MQPDVSENSSFNRLAQLWPRLITPVLERSFQHMVSTESRQAFGRKPVVSVTLLPNASSDDLYTKLGTRLCKDDGTDFLFD